LTLTLILISTATFIPRIPTTVDWVRYYDRDVFKGLSRNAGVRPPRWPVGTRVMACVEGGEARGTIVALYYQEEGWPDPVHSLYQICLDDGDVHMSPGGVLIYAMAEHQLRRLSPGGGARLLRERK